MIISLIGFMGCGKSSVGRRLSQLLCCPFIDLDAVIEEREGRAIAEIFAADGEAGFREIELNILSNTLSEESADFISDNDLQTSSEAAGSAMVLALGGGTVMTPKCAELVHSQTFCIYLKASEDILMERISEEISQRPLLAAHRDNLQVHISDLLSVRAVTYERVADLVIDTDSKSIEEIAASLAAAVSAEQ